MALLFNHLLESYLRGLTYELIVSLIVRTQTPHASLIRSKQILLNKIQRRHS